MTTTINRISLQILCISAMLVGGLAFGASADASSCVTDQFSGVCLPMESAPAQPKAINLASADLCDQISGVCRTPEIRSIDLSQPTQVVTDTPSSYDASCDQFSGVCVEAPSSQGERAQQKAGSSDL